MNEAMQTPITGLLASVPADARQMYEHSSTHHQNIPFGRLAAEALAEISRLTRELDEAKKQNDAGLKELAAAYARNGELHSRLTWHKVSDRLPDEDRYVLVHIGTECPETAWYDGVFWGMEEDDTETHELTTVTHWREIGPLPAAPNEAGK